MGTFRTVMVNFSIHVNCENYLKCFAQTDLLCGSPESVHGTGGPVHIEKLRFAPGMEYWLKAGQELGYEIRDLNGHQTTSKSSSIDIHSISHIV